MMTTTLSVSSTGELRERARRSLERCGVEFSRGDGTRIARDGRRIARDGQRIAARTPITGGELFEVPGAGRDENSDAVAAARGAFETWRITPAPVRGAVVKRFGTLVSEHKSDIAELITIEAGKIPSEALGEVQEVIDICDFAVGLSRQLDGRTMPSERPSHRLMETWHPLGVVAVISAFNFPAAVWSWNTAVALVCGDSVVWKPSPTTPLTSMACAALLERARVECDAPAGLHRLVIADADAAAPLIDSPDVALVSATGSERMGAEVAPRVAARLGRCLLELGGNNAAVVTPSADLELATRGIVFAAAGTAGQRCTTMRRVIAHETIVDELAGSLREVFGRLPIGDPFADGTLVGPLINERAYRGMVDALAEARADGGEVTAGGARRDAGDAPGAYYVEPALVRMPAQTALVRRETFAPILYVMGYRHFEEAIALHNGVPQGLSSSIFTRDQREAERFMAAGGSDCGIVNVNIGTSGAEIGGAFGGEKSTGGGRESGSDAWRAYMRRATNTINYSDELPLAQGVEFG
jgi:aldehyde dehydrogenase (NAD+)